MCPTQGKKAIELLLVEDNPGDRDLTKMAFKVSRVPCRIREAVDGEQALSILNGKGHCDDEAYMPDLILLDLNLPKVNGLEVLAEIRRNPRIKHIPVLVLSTSKAEKDIKLCYHLLANGYISKPDELGELREVVKGIDNFWFGVAQLPTA